MSNHLRPIGTSFIVRKSEKQTPLITDGLGKELYMPDDEMFTRGVVISKGLAHSDALQRLMDSIALESTVFFNLHKSVRIPGSKDLFLTDLDSIACVLEREVTP